MPVISCKWCRILVDNDFKIRNEFESAEAIGNESKPSIVVMILAAAIIDDGIIEKLKSKDKDKRNIIIIII